jgi:hypothetical protein
VESRDASSIAADQAAASARVTLANRQAERERKLTDQGVSPRADYETAQANLAVARADAMRQRCGRRGEDFRDGRSVMVTSPVSGRLTMASANLGQFVAAETELFRVADPRKLQITATVPVADAGRIKAGDRVELTIGEDQVIEGRARSSTGVVDPNSRGATVIVEANGTSGLVPANWCRPVSSAARLRAAASWCRRTQYRLQAIAPSSSYARQRASGRRPCRSKPQRRSRLDRFGPEGRDADRDDQCVSVEG